MKRLLMVTVLIGCAAAWPAAAQDADGRKGISEEDAKARQSVIGKYDADGDGVLSKSEQRGLSKSEKQTLARTGGVGTARKAPAPDAVVPGKGRGAAGAAGTPKGPEGRELKPDPKKESPASKGGEGGKGKGGKK